MGEPFLLPPERVLSLTRLQILYVYLHPRNDKGGLRPYGPPRSVLARERTPADPFAERWRRLGAEPWQVERFRAEETERLKRVAAEQKQRARKNRR